MTYKYASEVKKIIDIVSLPSKSFDEVGINVFNLIASDVFYENARGIKPVFKYEDRVSFANYFAALDEGLFSVNGFNGAALKNYLLVLIIDGISGLAFENINDSYYVGLDTSENLSKSKNDYQHICIELKKPNPSSLKIQHLWNIYTQSTRNVISNIDIGDFPFRERFGSNNGLLNKIKSDFISLSNEVKSTLSDKASKEQLDEINNSIAGLGFFNDVDMSVIDRKNINFIMQGAIANGNDDVVSWALKNNADIIQSAPYYVYPFNNQRKVPKSMSLVDMANLCKGKLKAATLAKIQYVYERSELMKNSTMPELLNNKSMAL